MHTLILYDSNFGNTKKIAEVIAEELGTGVTLSSVSELDPNDLFTASFLIVGSPINGWRPTEKMGKFLESLKDDQLLGKKVATFDTRIDIFFHGDAMKKMAKRLREAGAELITEPKAFFVKKTKGPLVEGEIEEAKLWAKDLKRLITK